MAAGAAIGLTVAGARSDVLPANPPKDPGQRLERTSFQTGSAYDPRIDIKSDVAMVYGINGDLPARMAGWRDHGYITQLMTGVAWGNYQDYFDGKWDGKSHTDEAQTDRNGNKVQHGPTVPYVAPSITYGKYLSVGVKKAIDAGAQAIYLEEPEFWVRSGYSESFKREWQSYYHEPWIAPHTSPDAQYRASKLKYFLYRRALQQVFDFVAQYGKKIGRTIPCYVPTHSMINYSQWGIVSPEQSLVMLHGCNGYIGQVWTGTARTPNMYQGIVKERTFETGYLEYGVLHNLVRSTGRRMYYLNDPVEDNPNHTWADYRRNWECTLVASLLWPDVWHYEVAPWPQRPFLGKYPSGDGSGQRVGISPGYATELLTVFNALNDMKQPKVSWDAGTPGIGVLVSDTMMFQRGDPDPSDPHLSSFYGLAMPLLKHGLPIQPVQLENVGLKNYLKPFRVLFLTYEGMKPLSPEYHADLAQWVRAGGILVFVDNDKDPYNAVKEWWNSGADSGAKSYAEPRQQLFEQLGLGRETTEGLHRIGKGALIYRRLSPASLAQNAAGAGEVVSLAREAAKSAHLTWRETNHLILRRGPYIVAAGLDESSAGPDRTLKGRLVNLLDPSLPVLTQIIVHPGDRILLLDLDRLDLTRPRVVASASKTVAARNTGSTFRFNSSGPAETMAATRVALRESPVSVRVDGVAPSDLKSTWDPGSHTILLQYPNDPAGRWVTIVSRPATPNPETDASRKPLVPADHQ